MEGRVPPHNMEAERSVLGAALLSKDALYDVMEVVRPDDFYDRNHKEIYEAMLDLNKKNVAVDVLTVAEELSKRNSLDMVGGRGYITSLSSGTPTTSNAMEYGKIVSEKAMLRKLINSADAIVVKGYEDSLDSNEMLDFAEREIFDISQSRQRGQYAHLKDVLGGMIQNIDKAAKQDGGLTGITTGFRDLDYKTAGLQKSDLIILAARPGMGKTSFALTVALNAALKANASIMIFNLEMSTEQLSMRLMSMHSKVDMQKLKTGQLDDDDWLYMQTALDELCKAKITIDDTPGISIMEMKSKCRKLKAEAGLDLVVIDYLQLMNPEGKNAGSREQEISIISRNLKLLARELDCPVIVLSQLSRKPEERNDKRPMLSDLRDSGAIEQDADIVIFLYRDDYYNKDSETPGECEIIVAKHRSGPTGTVNVAWLERLTKFVDIAGNSSIPEF